MISKVQLNKNFPIAVFNCFTLWVKGGKIWVITSRSNCSFINIEEITQTVRDVFQNVLLPYSLTYSYMNSRNNLCFFLVYYSSVVMYAGITFSNQQFIFFFKREWSCGRCLGIIRQSSFCPNIEEILSCNG